MTRRRRCLTRRAWTALALVLCLPLPARAQRVTGTLRDSLVSGGPLAGATVWIPGTMRTAKTDGRGHFQLDSVSPGSHSLTFSHPVFDSLGLAAPAWTIDVGQRGLSGLNLSVPPIAVAFPGACPRLTTDAGAFVGVVRNATTDLPLASVSVLARWYVLAVTPDHLLAWALQTAGAVTDAEGRFVVCGVPRDGEFSLVATLGTARTGVISQDLVGRLLGGRLLYLGPPEAPDSAAMASAPPVPRGSLAGSLRSTTSGQPIPEARIQVLGSTVATQTSASGGFALADVPLGTQVVDIAAVGFVFERRTVDVRTSAPPRLDLEIAPAPQVLPTIGVVGKGKQASTFEQRRRLGLGYFFTAEDLKRRGVYRVEDIFYSIPGFRVQTNGFATAILSTRSLSAGSGPCSPQVYVNGWRWPVAADGSEPLGLDAHNVEAVEIYPGTATVPVEFGGGTSHCGAIVLWERTEP